MPFPNKTIRDRARKEVAQRVRAGEPCCLCGRPIDLTLRYPDPWSFTVEHIIPTSHGGHDYGEDQLAPCHFTCNIKRGNDPIGTVGRNSGALG